MPKTKMTPDRMQEVARMGGKARALKYKNTPLMLLDLRKVWKAGLPTDETAKKALWNRSTPSQRVLSRLLEEKPGEFLKKLEDAEAAWLASKTATAEKAGASGSVGGTVAPEARHMKVDELLGKLMGEFTAKEG